MFQQHQFDGVAVGVGGAALGVPWFAVAGRIDIHATGEEDTVELFKQGFHRVRVVRHQRDQPGDRPDDTQALDVPLTHDPTVRQVAAGLAGQRLRCDADDGSGHDGGLHDSKNKFTRWERRTKEYTSARSSFHHNSRRVAAAWAIGKQQQFVSPGLFFQQDQSFQFTDRFCG